MSLIACLASYTGITVTHRREDERRFESICTSLLSCYCRMVTRYVKPAVCGACDMLLRERLRMRERERKKRAGCKERKRHSAHTMGCLNVTVALMGISYFHMGG